MIENPPEDPIDHAQQIAHEWADVGESYARKRMRELGIPEHRIGTTDIEHGGVRRAFMPHEIDGGGNDAAGRLNIDSGVLNLELNASNLSPEVASMWGKARLRDRIDAIIAHEDAEACGAKHAEAVQRAPDTELPISDRARGILRSLADHEKGPAR